MRSSRERSGHFGIVFATGGNYKSITESATFGGLAASASVDLSVH